MTDADEVRQGSCCNGRGLLQALDAAKQMLEANSNRINLLNVYPVPDGDTGTNMLLTMQAALVEARRSSARTVGEVALAIYKGALYGARGNSGVIFSQMLRGIAESLAEEEVLTPSNLAYALRQASETAYKGVTTPVEGTMLTVIRDVAHAVVEAVGQEDTLPSTMQRALAAGRRSVARTPELLEALRDAGVVDAGGEGICVILEGILRYMQGQPIHPESGAETAVAEPIVEEPNPKEIEGYCTEFLITGDDLDLNRIRHRMVALGNSVLVVGDERMLRVHVHTSNPGLALESGLENGTLHQIKVDNLEDQHREFIVARSEVRKEDSRPRATSGVSFVVVANGDGLVEVFKSLGVAEVVHGGETMNPSTEEMLEAVERAPTNEVILLPNDRNVVSAAGQVKNLTHKTVEVVPTKSMPQGIAALLAFNYEADLATNVEAMREAAGAIRTGQVARSTRKARLNGIAVEKGQILGLLDGEPTAVGSDRGEVALALLARAEAEKKEIITIYQGKGVDSEKAELLAQAVRETYPGKQIELVFGGQPFYDYILSVE